MPLLLRMVGLALRRPRLIPALLGAAWTFRTRSWARKPPFLPLPSRSYMRWRLETAFGDPAAEPGDEELARYLEWGRDMRRQMKRRNRA